MRTSIPYVKTPTDAYLYLLDYINRKGDQIIDENGYNTKELLNIQITITDPCNPQNWPIPNTGWKLPALDEYVVREILSPNTSMPDGFRYTYGERLFNYPYCSWEFPSSIWNGPVLGVAWISYCDLDISHFFCGIPIFINNPITRLCYHSYHVSVG